MGLGWAGVDNCVDNSVKWLCWVVYYVVVLSVLFFSANVVSMLFNIYNFENTFKSYFVQIPSHILIF